MAETKIELPRPSSSNTPPNCAICLGACKNKCFSNSCMHQFCFQCLMEWSKIKAECPLCKQAFKSIIHNIKSNEDYDEYVVPLARAESIPYFNEEYLLLPVPTVNDLSIQYGDVDRFHLRTTFTVDSRLENAIQEMFMTGPITSGNRNTAGALSVYQYHHPHHGHSHGHHHHQLSGYTTTEFRRHIYDHGLWANGLPDVDGNYRDCSPTYFRNNRSMRQRLVPWLNRELRVLLNEDTQLVRLVVDLIMNELTRHHIYSTAFSFLLRRYLRSKTNHFIHEFYHFMRSPYDLHGYDTHVGYSERRPVPPPPFVEEETFEVPDESSDSDVIIVNSSSRKDPVVIDLLDSSSDSDEPIMVSPNSQIPKPIASTSKSADDGEASSYVSKNGVNLPAKLRFKNKCFQEKEKKKRTKRKRQRSSSSSSTDLNREVRQIGRKYIKKMMKKYKYKRHSQTREDSDSEVDAIRPSSSNSEDDIPLINRINVKSKERKRSRRSRQDEEMVNQYSLRSLNKQRHYHNYPSDGPIDLSANCSRYSNTLTSCVRPMVSPPAPEWTASSTTTLRGYSQISPQSSRSRSESSTNRFHVELPTAGRSKVKLTENGQYTSVKIETSGSLADPQNEPSSSRTKIRIFRNGVTAPNDYHREGPSGYESASSPDYVKPTVKSEIREPKYENSVSSTIHARALQLLTNKPFRLKRSSNEWFSIPDSDSAIFNSTSDSTTNAVYSEQFSTSPSTSD